MPTGYQNNRTWTYNLIQTSTDRTGRRTNNLVGPRSRRVIGMDGSLEGGVGPMRGYHQIDDLGLPALNTINRDDFWVVLLKVGASETKRAYIYRTVNTLGVYSVFIRHWTGSEFRTFTLVAGQSGWGGNMSVTTRGRWCYIACRGKDPIGFYFSDQTTIELWSDTTETGTPKDHVNVTIPVNGRLGPGEQPIMLAPDVDLQPTDASGTPDGLLENESGDYDGKAVGIVHVLPADTAITGVGNDDERELLPAQSYGFAFRMRDRTNGRYSKLSNLAIANKSDFPVDADGAAVDGYVLFEILVDSNQYDTVQIYRTVGDITESEVSGIMANLFLEDEVTIVDADVSDSSIEAGFSKVFWWGSTNRISIMYQPQYANKALFDDRLPRGGTVIQYNNQLFFADIQETGTESENQVGQVRYSSSIESSPELFPPLNRWVPDDGQDEWINIVRFGSNLLSFSETRAYLSRVESGYFRAEQLHEGFGLAGRRALAVAGQLAYYANEKGLYVILGDGRMDRVPTLNSLFVDEWDGDASDVVMAYDPKDNTITGIKRSTKNGFILWLNTGTVTEVEDIPFAGVSSGLIPGETGAVRRAIWVTSTGILFHYDSSNENTVLTTLGQGGVFDVEMTWSPALGTATFEVPEVWDNRMIGTRVYFLQADDADDTHRSHAGHYLEITTVASALGVTQVTCSTAIGDHAGNSSSRSSLELHLDGPTDAGGTYDVTVSVAPIYFRWEGWALFGTEMPEFDLFRVRNPETMRPYFVDTTDTALVRCLIYEANKADPVVRSFAKDNAGAVVEMLVDNEPKHAASVETEGTMLFPGIEVVTAGLDYLMLGVVCEGRLLGTDFRGSFRS